MITPEIFFQICHFYPILETLPAPARKAILGDAFIVQGLAGQVAFCEGDDCSHYLFLAQGGLRIMKSLGGGREILLYNLRPGESCILTVSGILGRHPYNARGIWESEGQAYAIRDRLFLELVEESADFRKFIFQSFSDRIYEMLELIDAVAWKPVSSRLAALLLDKWTGAPIQYSHQMLASELGTVREVVSRCLKEFERQGTIKMERASIQILYPEGLQKNALGSREQT